MTGNGGKTAVVLDRHPLSRDALERVGVTVEGATTSPADALKMVEETQPTVFVRHIQQSEDRLASLNRVTAVNPGVHTVVLSTQDDAASIEAAFASGASLSGRFVRLEQQPQQRDLDEAECIQCDRRRQSRLERHHAVLLARVRLDPVATAASPRLG